MTASHYPLTPWMEFYEKIKDPSWPACCNEHEFHTLPDWIKMEITQVHQVGNLLKFSHNDVVDFTEYNPLAHVISNIDSVEEPTCNLTYPVARDFDVYYDQHMDSGGMDFGQDYPRVISYLYPNRQFQHCLEWCAGAGHIGFRMLADGICRQLTLLDAYQPALMACNKTIQHIPQRFKGRAHVVQNSDLQTLSSNHQFDLIIANPPHYPSTLLARNYFNYCQYMGVSSPDAVRIGVDQDWQLRKNFYLNIKKNLTADGVIVMQENLKLSQPEDFQDFIHQGGLKIVRSFAVSSQPMIWYLVVAHQ